MDCGFRVLPTLGHRRISPLRPGQRRVGPSELRTVGVSSSAGTRLRVIPETEGTAQEYGRSLQVTAGPAHGREAPPS